MAGTAALITSILPVDAAPHWHPVRPRPPIIVPGPPVYRPAPIPVPATPREKKEIRAQLALRQLGYYRGPIDGDIGPYTSRAILRFQRDRGLPMTGWLDVRTLRALGVL